MKPRVSVVIIVKNDPGVRRTLELVYQQRTTAAFEVIVIDASASDGLAAVRVQFPQAYWEQFDQHGKRFTINEQRNRGMELAQGEVIVFIDANCEPVQGWLEALLEAIDDGEDVVCGPCWASNPRNMVHYIQDHTERTYVQECTTINVALRRRVIDAVGVFDTSLEFGGDVDYMWRATDKGFTLCFEPKALITHDYGGSSEQIERAYRYGKARAILHIKHRQRRWRQLLQHEPHVWLYPLYIVFLPLSILWPYYLLFPLIPVVKNRSVTVTIHHFIFGWGVLVGSVQTLKKAIHGLPGDLDGDSVAPTRSAV